MRIGLISGEYPPQQGGVGDFTRELARALAADGHLVHVLTRVLPTHDTATGSESTLHITASVRNWTLAPFGAIRAWAAAGHFDVINLQYEAAALDHALGIHALAQILHPRPLVVTFHDWLVPYLFPKAGPLRQAALTYLARQATATIVTNEVDAVAATERLRGAKRPPAAIIPIGSNIVDQPPPAYDRAEWRSMQGFTPDNFVVGYFGFMNASKGVDTLLQGFAEALKDEPRLRLLMIGGRTGSSDPSNQGQADAIDTLITRLNLSKHVQWTGFVSNEQVSAHLHACDLVTLPYRDGVSYRRGSFMAALSHGCPIITTEPQVGHQSLRQEQVARLIPADDPTSLALALRELTADPTACKAYGDRARQFAQQFSWTAIASQTLAVYQRALVQKS